MEKQEAQEEQEEQEERLIDTKGASRDLSGIPSARECTGKPTLTKRSTRVAMMCLGNKKRERSTDSLLYDTVRSACNKMQP